MAISRKRVPIDESEAPARRGFEPAGRLHPDRRVRVTVHLRSRSREALPGVEDYSVSPYERRHLGREEFATQYGAGESDLARVEDFARDHRLDLLEGSSAHRSVTLAGKAGTMERAFGVDLHRYESEGRGRHHGHRGPVHVPAALGAIVEGVFGLDSRPVARAYFRRSRIGGPTAAWPPELAHYTAPRIGSLYDFPSHVDGSGQCIAILQLGGGFRRRDLGIYFRRVGRPLPRVTVKSVGGARNRPTGRALSADGEVQLDVEIAGSIAPGARIVTYFAHNTDRGFIDGVRAAVYDRKNRPTILSISWGDSEPQWSRRSIRVLNQVFREAAAMGITVCAAAGDLGASDGVEGGVAVDFPAASPYVLACGGTRLLAKKSRIQGEVVWNDLAEGWGGTGGGVSTVFPLPSYQKRVGVPRRPGKKSRGRGVPDVAGNADPETGYLVRIDGKWMRVAGTSAVSPLWAGLVARLNEALGAPVGFLNPTLYHLRRTRALRSITRGSNGAYRARPGWDACTGLGCPRGEELLRVLEKLDPRRPRGVLPG